MLVVMLVILSTDGDLYFGMNISFIDEAMGEVRDSLTNDGTNIARVLSTTTEMLVYFLLPLFILVASAMFSHNTIKNDLSTGMSRTKLYLSKLILSSILCAALMVFYMAAGIALATILRGFGVPPVEGYWLEILKMCSAQLFMLLAFNCVGIFLAFTAKRASIVNGAFIAICLVPSLIIFFLINWRESFDRLINFDLMLQLQRVAFMDMLPRDDIIKAFAVGTVYIVVSTVAGVMLFRKAEIS
jgi:ABC-type transport system involved in multi-copper enzyme maturation permease subunit